MREYNIHTALFNCHVNNAKEKTIEKCKKKWGIEVFNKEIQPFLDNGIMSMFHVEQNKYIKYFLSCNKRIVNG